MDLILAKFNTTVWLAMSSLLFLALICPKVEIINKTDVWNEHDKKQLEFVKKRCKHFYPKSPCVKTFIKKAERNHQVVCVGGRYE